MTDNTREDNTCLIAIEDFCDGTCAGCQYEREQELWKGMVPDHDKPYSKERMQDD